MGDGGDREERKRGTGREVLKLADRSVGALRVYAPSPTDRVVGVEIGSARGLHIFTPN